MLGASLLLEEEATLPLSLILHVPGSGARPTFARCMCVTSVRTCLPPTAIDGTGAARYDGSDCVVPSISNKERRSDNGHNFDDDVFAVQGDGIVARESRDGRSKEEPLAT
jgi:hypothetical protein